MQTSAGGTCRHLCSASGPGVARVAAEAQAEVAAGGGGGGLEAPLHQLPAAAVLAAEASRAARAKPNTIARLLRLR